MPTFPKTLLAFQDLPHGLEVIESSVVPTG